MKRPYWHAFGRSAIQQVSGWRYAETYLSLMAKCLEGQIGHLLSLDANLNYRNIGVFHAISNYREEEIL
jgi:hypothetical protein